MQIQSILQFEKWKWRSGFPCRHRGCHHGITLEGKTSSGLLDRLGGVVVKAGLSVFLFDEIKPVGGGVLEKMGVYSGTSPEPAFLGGPEPEVSI